MTSNMPSGYDIDGTVRFGINVTTLLNCLNMFGTAGGTTGLNPSEDGEKDASNVLASTPITAVKLSYDGIGSRLNIILEENGVVTTCGIPTFEPDLPVDFDFDDINHTKLAMRSKWLEEGLRDLDATSDRVVFRIIPTLRHLQITSLGTVETLDINYSQNDVLEEFVPLSDQTLEVSYNFTHVLYVLRACPISVKATICVDTKDFMRIQFLSEFVDQRYMFSEYSFAPIV
ncbi:ssDNA endodeoxyribonuclease [Haplosporangium sp. Z 767]|nr:ssDNA endodeoxyribonuclease [Haplosporangium sp. Z 767]KAF9188398.1 ssDNA endodeoxyribonuclease [Haplosporangium sp. Z 11]